MGLQDPVKLIRQKYKENDRNVSYWINLHKYKKFNLMKFFFFEIVFFI